MPDSTPGRAELLQENQLLRERLQQAEAAISQFSNGLDGSAQLYAMAIEGSGEGHWVWFDQNGNEQWWSPRLYAILGYSPAEKPASLQTLRELLHPEDRRKTLDSLRAALEVHEPYEIDFRLQTGSGVYRWLRATGKVVGDADNGAVRMAGALSEFDEQKQKELALSVQEQRLHSLYAIAAEADLAVEDQLQLTLKTGTQMLGQEIGIISRIEDQTYALQYVYDSSGTLSSDQTFPLGDTYCNVTLEYDGVFSIDHVEFSPYSAHPCYRNTKLESYIGIPLRVKGQIIGTLNFTSRKGRRTPFNEGDKEFVYLISRWTSGMLQRLHTEEDRSQIREALGVSNERYRSVIASLAEGIVMQGRDGQIIACNASAERILGMSADQMAGRTSLDPRWRAVRADGSPFPGEEHPAVLTLQSGDALSGIIMGVHKPGGELTWISINTQPIVKADEVVPQAVVSSFHDITETRNAVEALRASEERYDLAVRGSAVGLWDWDITNDELYWSPRHKEIIGLAESDEVMSQEKFVERLHPDDSDKVRDALRAHLSDRSEFNIEYRFRHPQGHFIWIHAKGQAVWNKDGTATRMAGSIADVTDQRLAEKELAHAKEELQMILDSMPAMIWYKSKDNVILRANKAAAATGGVTVGEMEGRHSAEFYPDMAEKYHSDDLEVIASGKSKLNIVEKITLASGEERWVRTDKLLYKNHQGEIIGVIAMAVDITTEKQSQLLLEASERKFRHFADNVPAVFAYIDANHQFRYVNKSFLDWFGLERDVIINREVVDVLGEEAFEKVKGYFARVLQGERVSYEAEIPYQHAGMKSIIATYAPNFDQSGRVLGFYALVSDITERKKAEEELLNYAAKLERANKELDDFAYVASHDLKSPLRAIDNLAGWIAEDSADALSRESLDDLVLLQQRVKRMERLLDDLLQYSRTGRVDVKPEKVELRKLIGDVIEMTHPPEEFAIEIPTEMPTLVTPKVPLAQVLRNLIGNAIKHCERRDGHIRIEASSNDTFITLRIDDNGPGIAADYQQQVFQMFQTLKPRDQVEGSGMGLAIVKRAVEAYGGNIRIVSSTLGGACFEFDWPRNFEALTEE